MGSAVPENVIVMWPGTNSEVSSLSGWSRVTELDSKMTKGVASASTNGGTAAGNNSHTHSSSSHTHAQISHTHTGTANNMVGTAEDNAGSINYSQRGCVSPHGHSFTTAAAAGPTSGGSDTSWGSSSALEPPYYEVIYIKSDGTGDGFPDDCIVYYNSGTDPTDWTQHAASVDKYFRGAGSGGNGGGTGGNASHTHSYANHTHNVGSHSHGATNSGGPDVAFDHGNGSRYMPSASHTHPVNATSSDGSGGSNNAGSSATSGAGNNVPPRTIMNAIQNDSGGSVWLEGAYCLWIGNIADIPTDDGFVIADGNNSTRNLLGKFILNDAANNSGHGGTNTSTTHGHSSAGHTHTANHSHSGSNFDSISANAVQNWNQVMMRNYINNHGHAGVSIGSTVSTGNNALSSTDPALNDNTTAEPAHVTVVYIMSGEEPVSESGAIMFGTNF